VRNKEYTDGGDADGRESTLDAKGGTLKDIIQDTYLTIAESRASSVVVFVPVIDSEPSEELQEDVTNVMKEWNATARDQENNQVIFIEKLLCGAEGHEDVKELTALAFFNALAVVDPGVAEALHSVLVEEKESFFSNPRNVSHLAAYFYVRRENSMHNRLAYLTNMLPRLEEVEPKAAKRKDVEEVDRRYEEEEEEEG
jgi:hypothetical protein